MARASRKQRLPFSRASGVVRHWQPSDADWDKIEGAYGVSLDDAARFGIAAIVDRYFAAESFGRNAPFADDAIEWLVGIEGAALSFVQAHSASGGGGAKIYAASLLKERLQETDSSRLTDIVRFMTNVAGAAREAARELINDEHPRFDEKAAWRAMIARLWEFADDAGFPTAINKSNFPKVSPFVAFVRELQATFGAMGTYHKDSPLSLAVEMQKATRDIRKLRKLKAAKI